MNVVLVNQVQVSKSPWDAVFRLMFNVVASDSNTEAEVEISFARDDDEENWSVPTVKLHAMDIYFDCDELASDQARMMVLGRALQIARDIHRTQLT